MSLKGTGAKQAGSSGNAFDSSRGSARLKFLPGR